MWKGRKHFNTRAFCNGLGASRVSFALKELFEEMIGTEIGAATVYSALIDPDNKILIVFDKDVADSEWYGCSDGKTTGYMKVKTQDILKKFMPYTKHDYRINTRIIQIDRKRSCVLQCITKGGEPLCFRLDYQMKMNVLSETMRDIIS